MKKLLFNLLVFGISLISLGLNANVVDTIKVACIGNSITAGDGVNVATESFPAQLQMMLGDHWNVKNYGISGRTMLKKGDYPYWTDAKNYLQEALEFNPNVVIIMLGTNDSKNNIPNNWQYKDEFYADYAAMVDTFAHLASNPEIWVVCPPKVFKELYSINDSIILHGVIPIVQQIAVDKNTHILNLYDYTSDKSFLFADGIHPNVEGHNYIAKIWYETLTGKALNKIYDTNVTLNKEVTSSSSLTNGEAKNINDGNLSKCWSAKGVPASVIINLGTSQVVDNFQLLFQDDKSKGYQYTIEGSDNGTNWNMIVDNSDRSDTETPYASDTFTDVSLQYIRLTITSFSNSTTDDTVNLYEFKALKNTGYLHAPIIYSIKNAATSRLTYLVPVPEATTSLLYSKKPKANRFSMNLILYNTTQPAYFSMPIVKDSSYLYFTSYFLDGVEVYSDTVKYSCIEQSIPTEIYFPPKVKNTNAFPNPFNNEVTITIPNCNESTRVKIVSIDGRVIKEFKSFSNVNGTQKLVWDGTDSNMIKVASGMYFCRIENTNSTQIQKIIYEKK